MRAGGTDGAGFPQFPVQSHRQLSCDGHLGHRAMTAAEFQPEILPPQFRIGLGGDLSGLDQQVAHHRVPLLADGTESLLAPATFFLGIQTEVTHDLLASLKTTDGSNRQDKRQCRYRSHSRLLHQAHCIGTTFCFLLHRPVQLSDPRVQSVEQLEQFLPAAAGPGIQGQGFQFLTAHPAPQFSLPAQALTHSQAVELVHHRSSVANQLVAMPQQVAKVSLGWRRHPDPWKPIREE